MKYNELTPSHKKRAKRAGRGIAAGRGKTAGRGTKGQNSRAGSGARPGFEGGQNPLMQRLPKLRGFRSIRPPVTTVYTGELEALKTTEIDNIKLAEAGLIEHPYLRVKVIDKGNLNKKMTLRLQMASTGALKKIEAAGGKFIVSPQLKRNSKTTDNKAK